MFPANEAPMCPAVDATTHKEEERMRRLDVAREAVALAEMTLAELRDRYCEVFGEECRSRHKGFLHRRILWGLQAQAEGGLTQRAQERAGEIADDAHQRLERLRSGRTRSPKPVRRFTGSPQTTTAIRRCRALSSGASTRGGASKWLCSTTVSSTRARSTAP